MYGQRIKELREEKELTQKQLGELLHCHQNTICRYETESHDLGTAVIIKLCQIFDVTSDYLLGIDEMTGAKKYR